MTIKPNIDKHDIGRTTKTPEHNRGLAKGGLMCFVETFVQGSTVVLRMNSSAKNPALRQAQTLWQQVY